MAAAGGTGSGGGAASGAGAAEVDGDDDDDDSCWRASARQHAILVNRGKKSKILSDVRLEACAVEHYPG